MAEVFRLQDDADAGWIHGRGLATLNVQAAAATERGVDLGISGQLDIATTIGGKIGKGIEASLAAGGSLRAGSNFRASYPLDLFHEAGLVARFRAQAAAAAYLQASMTLESEVLANSLAKNLSGAWQELIGI